MSMLSSAVHDARRHRSQFDAITKPASARTGFNSTFPIAQRLNIQEAGQR
jgi:hypothetical protein